MAMMACRSSLPVLRTCWEGRGVWQAHPGGRAERGPQVACKGGLQPARRRPIRPPSPTCQLPTPPSTNLVPRVGNDGE